ncbi:hypothetical protein PsorP6_010140 [Peronosclerospora sorghi]|uniref:Uncharacterized protein n=1 Tax=Peronosclerospora sorghi TaxID=230839 RepID=A0ACC0VW18_9STRA|nr:hypothetical protein PsorP6_010140 [Peronosclerospora sorghi]
MESRVYAEDPVGGFLPSIGLLLQYKEPTHLPGVRVDSGVNEGSGFSMFYDPLFQNSSLMAKITIMFHFYKTFTRHPRFVNGKITTKFIEEMYPEGFSGVKLTSSETEDLKVVGEIMHMRKAISSSHILGRIHSASANGIASFDFLNTDELEFVSHRGGIVPRLSDVAPGFSSN